MESLCLPRRLPCSPRTCPSGRAAPEQGPQEGGTAGPTPRGVTHGQDAGDAETGLGARKVPGPVYRPERLAEKPWLSGTSGDRWSVNKRPQRAHTGAVRESKGGGLGGKATSAETSRPGKRRARGGVPAHWASAPFPSRTFCAVLLHLVTLHCTA